MAGGPKLKLRLPRLAGLVVWAPIALLLTLGLLTTLIDFSNLPLAQATHANEHRQRFVINAVSGEVSLGDTNPEALDSPASAFDVGSDEEAVATPPEGEAAPTKEVAPPETPASEPVATEPTPGAAAPPAAEPVASEPVAAPATDAPPLPEGTPTLRTTALPSNIEMPAFNNKSLVGAPAPEVTETVDGIRLPKRGLKDINPSKLYAHRFTRKPEQVIITFMVMNAGLDPQSIGLMLALPPEVTIAYSPYARPESSFTEHMRAAGHEVWTMLPTMNDRYPNDDPGPLGIIGRMPAEEVTRRTRLAMGAIAGSVGFILPPDEAVSILKGTLAPALDEISGRGLLLLSTHPSRSIDQITTTKGMDEIIRRADLILDPSPSEPLIRSKLASIIDAAKLKGEYIVLLSARPQSLQLLTQWLKETKLEEPFALAPLSAFYAPKGAPVVAAPADDGHGKKKEEKPKPKEKKPKVLIQDQYKQPAEGAKKESGGH